MATKIYREPKKPIRNRPIRAALPVLNGKGERQVRCYGSLKNAIVGSLKWLLISGKVGEFIELFHDVTGLQFGTIRLNVHGQIQADFCYKDYL